ncbi:MAG: Cadmium-transporting ATPase [Phycisphaerae bacterium]|nr:Cadmium-transporting ATPase [Phycisphaerae bacterium]
MAEPSAAATTNLRLAVSGMDCPNCAATIDKAVGRMEGVLEARTNFAAGTLEATIDRARVGRDAIVARIRSVGYDVADESGGAAEAGGVVAKLRRHRRLIATGACGLLLAGGAVVGWATGGGPVSAALCLAATAAGGFYVARAATMALAARRLDMNVLMCIAIIGAIAIGYFSEAATVTFLFALSLWLEERSMGRARHAIGLLMKLRPDRVRMVDGLGREQMLPIEQVRVGDRIRVHAGERIGLDGRVVAGVGAVDTSAVTGESMPADCQPGSDVLAGSISLQASLTIETTRLAGESTISRIIRLVEQAQAARAPAQRLVDRFAAVYTPIVVASAVLIAVVPPLVWGAPLLEPAGAGLGHHGWLYRALVLLVIACPCALVISTPVSVISALAAAARQGVLIKGGAHLETLARVHCVLLDKTGTLTRGRPAVADVVPVAEGMGRAELLRIAAALESESSHPIARAVLHQAREEGIDWPAPADARAMPGCGVAGTLDGAEHWLGNAKLATEQSADLSPVADRLAALEATGNTVMILGRGREVLCLIAAADEIRDSALEAMRRLRQAGRHLHGRGGATLPGDAAGHRAHLVLLTGDTRPTAEAVVSRLGLDDCAAQLLPGEKVDAVNRIRAGCTGAVAMVGDGINDAPALAAADVGIAMGTGGADAALETADVALIGDDLAGVPFAVGLGRRTRRTIAQNVWFSLLLKAAFLGLGVLGLASLWMAVFADMGASLLVTGNGLRLLWAKREG